MNIQINGERREIAEGATVADAVALLAAQPPYAAAVNRSFVPRSQHAAHVLQEGDEVEIIRPVTGG
ncbi:sulfur carrier protein ThiS [Xenophilus sp. Marseille-Q4582]|uniref:sulfur carrier protein ThiS n=1 Tax=Xenophilus sp. Marseille-Q4582 TaxID=2866600 RepID=UPI001CE44C82|nr:sulfur carrier protein ThiS [Xenophilus sp. Marseille-Q4582]